MRKNENENYSDNLSLSGCTRINELYSSDGVYLKSLCEISSGLDFEGSKIACAKIGMYLFTVSDNEVQKSFLHMASTRFADRAYARLWINGKRYHSSWYTENQSEQLTDLNWHTSSSDGDCLSTVKFEKGEPMLINGWTCGSIAWAYCEFYKPESNVYYHARSAQDSLINTRKMIILITSSLLYKSVF